LLPVSPPPRSPVISFIVPVKDGLAYTRALVQTATAGNPGSAIEWVIVDSGSTDGTLEFCREIGARMVPFSRTPFNYCAAVNAGAREALGDVWIVANNDIELRSHGDLARLERLFDDWPLLAVVSPGRPSGEAELEFVPEWVNGATWAVRPAAFRAWGGMPEEMSGYGYDEAFTAFQCWRHGFGNAWLTGWDVYHHGSVTFGPLGGNVTPALRRNLSRLLAALDSEDLDRGAPEQVMDRLRGRERDRAPVRLVVPERVDRHGYVNARPSSPGEAVAAEAARVVTRGGDRDHQWLPWLANELLLQPDAEAVGADGWYAIRPRHGDYSDLDPLLPTTRAVGPPPPPLMPELEAKRPTFRQRISALLHTWRARRNRLPDQW
jgi:hypothetical protein